MKQDGFPIGVAFARRIRRGGHGFSLAELLIVIGILTVLVGLVLSAATALRARLGQVQCAANLRQWAAAARLYATANDGFLPRRGQGVEETVKIDRPEDWFNALPVAMGIEPYRAIVAAGAMPHGGVWVCPQATGGTSGNDFTFGMNMWLSTWDAPQPDHIDRVGDASTMVFMADAPAAHCSVVPAAAAYSPVARHGGRANIAFLDGHVQAFDGQSIGCGIGDPRRFDVRWEVPGSTWRGPH
jgi:prepilin-type processing-associated H-X9-DG protein/prepilin-type N-terminal cleavage/methylation domain-containing protein